MDTRKAVEEWAKDKATPGWLFAAAKASNSWPVGKELAEAEFDQALETAGNGQILGNPPPPPTPTPGQH